jgi:hypothetical protein
MAYHMVVLGSRPRHHLAAWHKHRPSVQRLSCSTLHSLPTIMVRGLRKVCVLSCYANQLLTLFQVINAMAPKLHNGTPVYVALKDLTLAEMKCTVPHLEVTRRSNACNLIAGAMTEEQLRLLHTATEKREKLLAKEWLKKKITWDQCKAKEKEVKGEFLDPITKDIKHRCIANFNKRTSNKQLQQTICIVCAWQTFQTDTRLYEIDRIPNRDCLKLTTPHPKMELCHGMLLELDKGMDKGRICNACYPEVEKGNAPMYALANDMWIGKIPVTVVGLLTQI